MVAARGGAEAPRDVGKARAEFRFVAKPDACKAVSNVVEVVAAHQADVIDRATRQAQRLASDPACTPSPDTVTVGLQTDELSDWEERYVKPFNTADAATTQLKPSWNPKRVLRGLAATIVLGVLVWQLCAGIHQGRGRTSPRRTDRR
jgi:hypothetical protein